MLTKQSNLTKNYLLKVIVFLQNHVLYVTFNSASISAELLPDAHIRNTKPNFCLYRAFHSDSSCTGQGGHINAKTLEHRAQTGQLSINIFSFLVFGGLLGYSNKSIKYIGLFIQAQALS
jgi:hypothetical protein